MTAIGLLVLLVLGADDSVVQPLPQAHAHNDYLHARPLLDALDQGFCNVEADIFAVNGELLVAHSFLEIKKERTLEKLYLEPLRERVAKNSGRVYANGPLNFTLLVDFKSKPGVTYPLLRQSLEKYSAMLTRVEGGKVVDGAVRVVLSGSRPSEEMLNEEVRLVGLDGRPNDLSSDRLAHLMPMISDSWGSQFQWKGDGPFPAQEKEKLDRMVAQAHAKGRVIRFWATPEKESVWNELVAAKVDLINTDDLVGLRKFLESTPKRSP